MKDLWDEIFLALKKCHWFDEYSIGCCSGSWSWVKPPGELNPKCIHCPKWDHIDRREEVCPRVPKRYEID